MLRPLTALTLPPQRTISGARKRHNGFRTSLGKTLRLWQSKQLRRLENAIAVSAQGRRVVNITLRIKGKVRASILNSGTAAGGCG